LQKGKLALPVSCTSYQECGCHLNILYSQTSDCMVCWKDKRTS